MYDKLHYTKQRREKFHFREEIVVDGSQRLILEVTHARKRMARCYFTVVSKNVLTEAPIVIGPMEMRREEWEKLAKGALSVVEMLVCRTYKKDGQFEVY